MRVTERTKLETRERIVAAACQLFRERGFGQATTRDIAQQAGIAAGTLFNYFTSKEAIVVSLLSDGLERARGEFHKLRREHATLEEDLFLHISTGLRKISRCRKYVRPVLETLLSPLAQNSVDSRASSDVRVRHLQAVHDILESHARSDRLTPVASHLYWTLYTGVLAFWSDDSSPKQEDTLALLDHSVSMFVTWLETQDNTSP